MFLHSKATLIKDALQTESTLAPGIEKNDRKGLLKSFYSSKESTYK